MSRQVLFSFSCLPFLFFPHSSEKSDRFPFSILLSLFLSDASKTQFHGEVPFFSLQMRPGLERPSLWKEEFFVPLQKDSLCASFLQKYKPTETKIPAVPTRRDNQQWNRSCSIQKDRRSWPWFPISPPFPDPLPRLAKIEPQTNPRLCFRTG